MLKEDRKETIALSICSLTYPCLLLFKSHDPLPLSNILFVSGNEISNSYENG